MLSPESASPTQKEQLTAPARTDPAPLPQPTAAEARPIPPEPPSVPQGATETAAPPHSPPEIDTTAADYQKKWDTIWADEWFDLVSEVSNKDSARLLLLGRALGELTQDYRRNPRPDLAIIGLNSILSHLQFPRRIWYGENTSTLGPQGAQQILQNIHPPAIEAAFGLPYKFRHQPQEPLPRSVADYLMNNRRVLSSIISSPSSTTSPESTQLLQHALDFLETGWKTVILPRFPKHRKQPSEPKVPPPAPPEPAPPGPEPPPNQPVEPSSAPSKLAIPTAGPSFEAPTPEAPPKPAEEKSPDASKKLQRFRSFADLAEKRFGLSPPSEPEAESPNGQEPKEPLDDTAGSEREPANDKSEPTQSSTLQRDLDPVQFERFRNRERRRSDTEDD